FTAEAIDSHGTHVAGTIACNESTPAVVSGADIPYDPSGVAPGAQLGSYTVFPGNVENARSEDILNAMQQAALDGMDVINMSLGGNAHGIQDLNTVAVDNMDRAGIVMAISAGNEGPGYYTAGSPGSAERALTAGASSVGHFVGAPILTGEKLVTVAMISDEFPLPGIDVKGDLAVLITSGTLSEACAPLTDGSLTGKIALLSRGNCSFGQKVFNAEQAGAEAVIVVNSRPGDPIGMAADAAFPTTIGAVMVGLADKATMMDLADEPVTIGADNAYKRTGNDNILMDFSSFGPTDVSNRVKPDVVAPGGNVLSAVTHYACEDSKPHGCWAFYSGTSMASPHLAGMAAVVKQANPTWAAWQIRSAIVNTAQVDGVIKTDLSGIETDVLKVGSGLANLEAAVTAKLVFSSPSISFGAVPSGSGKALTKTVTVTNVTNETVTTAVTIESATVPGAFKTTTTTITLAKDAIATIPVSYYIAKGSAPGPVQAHLIVGTEHVALFALAK
ncbi:MAG TPA: S8 family serine peptidase, partial [Propionibacteriaceae bacterium]|nr:S8 family serine peptidase [Propionibacteriaceae bacterium]